MIRGWVIFKRAQVGQIYAGVDKANIPVVRAGAPHVFVATIYATDSSASINGGMAENVVRLGFGPFNGFGIFPCDHREFRHKCPLPARAV